MRTHLRGAAAIAAALVLAVLVGCRTVEPPRAKVVPHPLVTHGDVRIDDYYWLADRDDPEVLAYLEAENAYTEAKTAHTRGLRETLFEEIRGRIKQDDSTVPYLRDGFWYYRRTEAGKAYPIFCRKKGTLDAAEEILLDVNALAEGHAFCSVAGLDVSRDGARLAYGIDTRGRRIYTLRVKDLRTGEPLPDTIPEVTGNVVFANDGRTLFYTKQDPVTLRAYQVFRHTLGTDPAGDALVFEETDDTFDVRVSRTRSNRFLLVTSRQTLSTEVRFLDADDPSGEFRILQPRERNHEYSVDHRGDRFYVVTNLDAPNFRLVEAPVESPGKEKWVEVVPHRPDVLLERVALFRDHLVLLERKAGLPRIRIRSLAGSQEHEIEFPEPAYDVRPSDNREFDTTLFRFEYSSLKTPDSVYDYDMTTGRQTLRKRDEILGGFDPANYRVERLEAPARDGRVAIPISLVRRVDPERDGPRPLLLYGYGSYGASMDAGFNPAILSLVDRGFTYAIAHVRGGQELGRAWYEDGKLARKMNTFTDFIDCAEYLVRTERTSPDHLYALGGSAGGLLMGAVVNLRPDLFHGVVARVPFVDVVTTMLDDSIPLTTSEYDEWGNPNVKEDYATMLAYSPYDNVAAKAYPNLLVTTGLHDSQVQYFEPAKWVAKLRAKKTDGNLLLLKTNMQAGHGGASGRYERYKETAFLYTFLLDLEGIEE